MTAAPDKAKVDVDNHDIGRITVRVTAVMGTLGLAVMGGSMWTSLRSQADVNARLIALNTKTVEAIMEKIDRLPTNESMESSILRAMRPLDAGMAKVEAELRALSQRVQRIEDAGK